jgi:hypothetical protein
MKPAIPKPLRCAIYTRKSTDERWRLLPEHYDDGGLSGASLERPAVEDGPVPQQGNRCPRSNRLKNT